MLNVEKFANDMACLVSGHTEYISDEFAAIICHYQDKTVLPEIKCSFKEFMNKEYVPLTSTRRESCGL